MAWRYPLFAAALVAVFAFSALAEDKKSGFDFMTPENQAMQRDDFSNPGMLSIAEGERLWQAACTGCHGEARQSMRGVAIRYPQIDKQSGRLIDLQERINLCRREKQSAAAFAYESPELLALTAYVAHQSRGQAIAPPSDATLDTHRRKGEALFQRRLGQLGLSCAACHEGRSGQRLGGSIIPQAHPTAYPLYRLEWQALGSLQRRLRNCMAGIRAEPYPFGAPEYVDIELFLMWRARGMPIEAPAVRP